MSDHNLCIRQGQEGERSSQKLEAGTGIGIWIVCSHMCVLERSN
ncbi:MAG: hypothetical protein JWM56_33 [Candidatus Peribacteria bacterium]|nr:hypothetical protein [Candidatus Peribacteria bacterium]